jgi:hypothetical protein
LELALKFLTKGKIGDFFHHLFSRVLLQFLTRPLAILEAMCSIVEGGPHKKLSELFFISKMRIIFTSFTSKNERSSMDKLVWHIFLRQHLKRI